MQITRGVWQMSLAMIISGSIGAFVLLSGLPVIDVVFWRCLIGALTLLLFIVLSRQPFSRLTRFTLALAVLGGIALVINWLLLFAAYSRISIGMATVVYNTQPFMLVLMGMVLGERVSAVKWGWLLLAFGGVVILLSSELAPTHGESLTAGVLLALGAAFFYALTAIIARKLHPLPAQHIAFIQVLVGVVMLLPLVQMPDFSASFPWRYLLILGVVHTGIMYQLLYSAIQKLPTPITGSLSFIYPLVAMGVDYLVFHHALTPVQLLGGMLILFAAAGNNLGWGEKNPARAGSVSGRGPVSDGRGQSGICASGTLPARSRYEPGERMGTAGTGSSPAPGGRGR
ncbi:Permease of the drug/metabolite transporter (DMT) superfamily [Klebsiella quasipneumoniae subsp. similipneumoniae]